VVLLLLLVWTLSRYNLHTRNFNNKHTILPRVVLIVFAADFQESKGSSRVGVSTRSAKAAQRKGEGDPLRA
jgi:hypothetical protein